MSQIRKKLGWFVHFYTALGLVANLFSLFALVKNDAQSFFLLNLLAVAIDGTDGFMARYLEVKKNIPEFDGALLDNIIDFLTFTFLPLSALIFLGILAHDYFNLVLLTIPIMASSYGFCQTRAKTEDAFVGFPSYWNIIVLYFFLFKDDLSPVSMHCILITLSILVFVPIHYVYPTKTKKLFKTTLILSSLYMILLTILSIFPTHPSAKKIGLASLIYVLYYSILSFNHHFEIKRRMNDKLISH
jgi:phosphatidylcholine synthase